MTHRMINRTSWVVQVDRHHKDPILDLAVVDRKHFQSEQEARAWANSQRREGVHINIGKTIHTNPVQSTEVDFDGLTPEEQGNASDSL